MTPAAGGPSGAQGGRWLADRFAAILTDEGDTSRVRRGRAYADQGAVSRLRVRAGEAAARVRGSRGEPYRVSVIVPVLSQAEWDTLARALAGQPVFGAALLSGGFPAELERVGDVLGLRLVPRGLGDLVLNCSCPDWGAPCKHAAAVLFALAEELAADPFLLVEWLGRPRGELLADLRRHARRPAALPEREAALSEPEPPAGPAPEPPQDAADYWKAPALPRPVDLAGIPSALTVTAPPPPGDDEDAAQADLAELLAPLYARFARHGPGERGE
ncbi:SWIM zinc finger family protein [Streptomonospora litoralis]|uniref:SWIM zinc finger protein n=1 Tax=Streptomonospora litoralis TaxID=2498135 RepID=A0A4P6Q4Z5_9ACTN|nr:SWIM zinc finger family protein [Streptomonospora litoralis]QBI54421.1 SWIM zinc finger protein [Streptomonospora litoralis]